MLSHKLALQVGLVMATAAMLAATACGEAPSSSGTPTSSTPSLHPSPSTPIGGTTIKQYSESPPLTIDADKKYIATIHTNQGTMTLELFPKEAPKTVNNFVFLAQDGFYDGVVFHRVLQDFMIQGGDPTGTGSGGPGYRFEDEPVTRDYLRGTLAIANSGPNTNGSQFFIVHKDSSLPKQYNIFGVLTDGFEVLDTIATTSVSGPQNSSPAEPQVIQTIEIQVLDGD